MQLDLRDKPRTREAYMLAASHHAGIQRKYTGEPYFNHPVRVATAIVGAGLTSEDAIAAALLHDAVEDPNTAGHTMHKPTIKFACGDRVLRWVELLSCTQIGTRAERKARYTEILAGAPMEVQAIKFADIADNIRGLAALDPVFAATYIEEKDAQVRAISPLRGSPAATLKDIARDILIGERNALALQHLATGRAAVAKIQKDDALIEAIIAEEQLSAMREVALF